MKRFALLALTILFALGTFAVSPVAAQIVAVPNSMNFQGRLAKPDGTPVANGTYSIRFSLWNLASGGTQAANEKWNKTAASVPVKNGVFAVTLDAFPAGLFNGNLWLEIKIGTNAALTPRQQLVSVAYAFKADSVKDGAITGASIANETITADKFANNLLNPLAWRLGGNSGTDPNSNFLGTTDNQSLEFRVNNRRAMQYRYAENTSVKGSEYRSINVLGGSPSNTIAEGVVGATIAGGGFEFINGTAFPNRVLANFGTVGGGYANDALGLYSTIGGGLANTANGYYATIGGGTHNKAIGNHSTVGGGEHNTVLGYYATVGGGYFNSAMGYISFAAGRQAQANHAGAFVWADNYSGDFESSAENQFCIRATGGLVFESLGSMAFYTGSTSGEKNRYVYLLNSPQTPSASGLKAGGILCADSYTYSNPGKNNMVVKGSLGVGYPNPAPYIAAFNGNVFANGTYSSSDARYKKNITSLDNALESILHLHGVSYDWDRAKFPQLNFGEDHQMGFIAQEVEKVFPHLVVTSPDGYKAVNYTGVIPVLVEAVKTLHSRLDRLNTLEKENAALKTKNEALEARLNALAAAVAELKSQRK